MKDVASIAQSHGFTLTFSVDVSFLDGTAYTLFHEKSGAKLFYLENEDPEKAFTISFKTPPVDDTGVFHILEHSVLEGSRKFPVKSPFVYLQKSSMSTYLNAETYPDHTTYPVASTNEQDLMNLMDVYLDAVFYPSIYNKRTIFEQEGWHLEFDADGNELTYSGVVYNEMKGALSNPNKVLIHTLNKALFPDTAYRFVSGGTPEAIPDLTYEEFLDSHRRHYRTDNSCITLYGDLDIDRFLAHIDDEYLTPLAYAHESDAEKEVGEPNTLDLQSPVIRTGVKKSMVTSSENACAALGFVTGVACASESERQLAIGILLDVILNHNEAPLKRALLDYGIADDVFGGVFGDFYQPYAFVVFKGFKPGTNKSLLDIFEEQVQKLIDEGLDHNLLEADISHLEFATYECDLPMSKGLSFFSNSAILSWVYGYDDEHSTENLDFAEAFAHLRKRVDEGYFEQLLGEVFLENDHFAEVEVVPCESVEPSDVDKRLADLSNTLNTDTRQKIENDVAALRVAQEIPDNPENIKKLPQLSIADIGKAPAEGEFGFEKKPVPCLRHHLSTHGIAYVHRYFDLSHITFEDLPYVEVLSMVLGRLDTSYHSSQDLGTLSESKLGRINVGIKFFSNDYERDVYVPKFVASASALSENVEFIATIMNEILLNTDFSDHKKIFEILMQRCLAMKQGCIQNGNSFALMRVMSYFLPIGVVYEQLSGMDFYIFLKDLCDHFDERISFLENKLRELAKSIFVNKGCLLSYTGTDEDLKRLVAAGITFGDTAAAAKESFSKPSVIQGTPFPVDKHEAFIIPSDVSFTSMGFDCRLLDVPYVLPYSGAWLVASRVLSYDYLWDEIRVKGGAYGVDFQVGRSGVMQFYSYRDPHIDKTIERFCAAGKWLSDFSPSKEEIDGYAISTVAEMDSPITTRGLISQQDTMFFSDRTLQDRLRIRAEVIESTVDGLRALGDIITQATDQHLVCTFGNRELVESSNEDFNVIDIFKP